MADSGQRSLLVLIRQQEYALLNLWSVHFVASRFQYFLSPSPTAKKKKEKNRMLLKALQMPRCTVQMRKLCIAMPLTSSLRSGNTVVIALPARQLSLWGMLDAVRGRKQIGTDQNGNTFWEISNPGTYIQYKCRNPLPELRSVFKSR